MKESILIKLNSLDAMLLSNMLKHISKEIASWNKDTLNSVEINYLCKSLDLANKIDREIAKSLPELK